MATVGDFLKFLNAPQFQLSPTTLTIKNYFQFLYRAEEELTTDVVQSFFDSAMSYPHWQQHKGDLNEECENLFTAFFTERGENIGLNEIDWPEQIQVIDVARAPTALEILHNFWTFRFKKGDGQFRVFEMGDNRYATVILHADHKLTVHQCNSQFLIRNGNLEPVQRNLVINYTADLDLDPHQPQFIEVAPYVLCRFYANAGSAQGHLVRGYVFQNLQNLQGQRLETQPRLFFALKRMETLFIRKESDPFYNQLIENLERLLHWIRLGEPINTVEVHENYLRAQTALEEVFRGDKMLTLLLRDLEHLTTRSREKPWPLHEPKLRPLTTESGSIKSLRTAAWHHEELRTASSKMGMSPSTEKKSTSSAQKSIPKRTKFSWMENN